TIVHLTHSFVLSLCLVPSVSATSLNIMKMPRASCDEAVDIESQSSDERQKAMRAQLMAPVKTATDEWVRGDPGPFGLLCFGMTTCMLMFITTKWAENNFLSTVMCYAMFYGGFGQFVAGVLELIKGNTFGGTAFSSYGAFWMGWFLLKFISKQYSSTFGGAAETGMTLWCGLWAFLTAGFFVVTMRKNGCLMTIFSSLVITFILLAGGEWNDKCHQAAGYVGFFCGSSAIYAAFAFLYKIELGIVLPGARPVAWI
ncbi:hypothetical protein Vretifemale_5998, partial [Volvox reticuliferus]